MKPPPIRGLVLGGGFSRRFGEAKVGFRPAAGERAWGEARLSLLRELTLPAALSLRPGQNPGFTLSPEVERIDDRWSDGGPMAGLLSAWECHPEAAWLVIACDLAALGRETVETLLAARDFAVWATAFCHPDDGGPEPLCALYEPAARSPLGARFAAGRRSLRGFLCDAARDSRARIVEPPSANALRSRNHPGSARG